MPGPRKKRTAHAATLADVGREAGVSAMAASAVLNSARTSSRISPETRARILDAAARLHYRPNAAARALAARRMHTIGLAALFYGGESNAYFLQVLDGVLECAARHEQNTTIFALHDWHREASRLQRFCDGRIDGMILLAPYFSPEELPRIPEHTPFVSIHANSALPGIVNVESDEETGAFNMVRLLIELGHRRILHFSGDRSHLGGLRRIAGYRRALQSAGIAFDESLVIEAGFGLSTGRDVVRRWFESQAARPLPDAVFCANDAIAAAAMEVLAASGIRVPGDVSIAGFDDTTAARTTVPQLTTVQQPLREMGAAAVETLLGMIRRNHAGTEIELTAPVVFPTKIVVRQSVTAPRAFPVSIPELG